MQTIITTGFQHVHTDKGCPEKTVLEIASGIKLPLSPEMQNAKILYDVQWLKHPCECGMAPHGSTGWMVIIYFMQER